MQIFSFTSIVLIMVVLPISAQQKAAKYDYKYAALDAYYAGKADVFFENKQVDSARFYLRKYRSRLGFTYYRLKAIEQAHLKSALAKLYLDSAFRRGMTPECILNYESNFGLDQMTKSYSENYLGDYDRTLITTLDSLELTNWQYRLQLLSGMSRRALHQFKYAIPPETVLHAEDLAKKRLNDSLWQQQYAIDISNQKFLFQLIEKRGWPSAKMIGNSYCTRAAPSALTILSNIRNADTNRKVQIQTLKLMLPLCEKNEEDWGAAEQTMYCIHNLSRNDFQDFTFISVNNGMLNKNASSFSATQMALSVIKNCTEVLEIKCKNQKLFEQLRDYMIELGSKVNLRPLDFIYESERWPLPLHPALDSFIYVPDEKMNNEEVQYRFVQL